MIALIDNTVLSNFARTEGEQLLRKVFRQNSAITENVLAEFVAGVQLGLLPPIDWSWMPVLSLTSAEQTTFHKLRQELGAGESSCLAIARHRNHRVLTDDRRCRRVAAQLGVGVSGTLGILVWHVQQGTLTLKDADSLLHRMITSGYHSPVSSLDETNML